MSGYFPMEWAVLWKDAIRHRVELIVFFESAFSHVVDAEGC
jgi:hypothetical protein